MRLELQFFGGRGSSGGNNPKSAAAEEGRTFEQAKAAYLKQKAKEATKEKTSSDILTATKSFSAGTYVAADGEEYEVSYREVKGIADGAKRIEQMVDGHAVGGEILDHGKGMPKGRRYSASSVDGGVTYTDSLTTAGKYAFGKPSDDGWKKKK